MPPPLPLILATAVGVARSWTGVTAPLATAALNGRAALAASLAILGKVAVSMPHLRRRHPSDGCAPCPCAQVLTLAAGVRWPRNAGQRPQAASAGT